jgi:replicative DNA helicase
MDDGLRMPPQNLNAEQAVLGSMTMAEEAAEYGVANLKESDFYSIANTKIFLCIKSLLAAKVPCDAVTMTDELAKRGLLDDIGGANYIVEILEAVPTWAHIRYYAGIVKRESVRRRLIQLGLQLQDQCYDPSIEVEPLISKLSQKLEDLVAERSNDLQSVAVVVQKMREEERKPRYPHPTGLEDVDKLLNGGLRPKELSVLAARPSIGKTSLGMQISENIAKREDAVLFFSVEMADTELITRVAKQGPRRAEEISKLPLFIEDQYVDLDDILNCIRLGRRRNMIKVVVIDYVQLMRTNDRLQKHEKIERCMNELKWIAKELRISVLVLAQINRESEKRDDKRPRLADLKGAGAIEESADVAMLLHRPEFYNPDDLPGCAEIIIAKNRNGMTGTVQVGYVKEKTLFVPYANRPIDISGYDGKDAPF